MSSRNREAIVGTCFRSTDAGYDRLHRRSRQGLRPCGTTE